MRHKATQACEPTDRRGTPDYKKVLAGLKELCRVLAWKIVEDGEGATRVVKVEVRGARNAADAELAGRAVAGSALVKTAVTTIPLRKENSCTIQLYMKGHKKPSDERPISKISSGPSWLPLIKPTNTSWSFRAQILRLRSRAEFTRSNPVSIMTHLLTWA